MADLTVAEQTLVGRVTGGHVDDLPFATVTASLGTPRVYSKAFAYNTANLDTGITVWTPAVGDVLLDAWVTVTEAFNGTTPTADIGTFDGGTQGLASWASFNGTGFALGIAADEAPGAGMLMHEAPNQSLSSYAAARAVLLASGNAYAWQITFTATNPLKLVVSQDGTQGGTAIGGTTGAATLYLMVASPVAL